MNTWTDLLIRHVKKNTHAPQPTDRTDKTPWDDSCVSFGSTFPDTSQNIYDAGAILERAAIQEYEGNLSRDQANIMAAADADSRRPRADGDTQQAMEKYRRYIGLWQPSTPGDLPSPPPNCPGNGPLWEIFWQCVP